MKQSLLTYIKIISFAIKKQRILEFIDLAWQKFTDRWKRHRRQEYTDNTITLEEALQRIFPNKISFDNSIFSELEKHLDNFIKTKSAEKYPSTNNPYPVNFALNRDVCRFLFFLCRFLQPELVVETGVANGFSSSYILLSLDYENKGKLISIEYLIMPWHTKEKVGLAIPDQLKSRHTLIVEKSKPELRKLLRTMGSIDVFIHDSSHVYKHMMQEFRIAWPHMKNDGFLLSDDVFRNDAFLDFSDEVERKPIIVRKRGKNCFGIIQK